MTTTPPQADPNSPADLAFGSFSEDPPWIVDPDNLRWTKGLDTVRSVVRRQVPELIKPRRVPSGTRVFKVVKELGTAIGLWSIGGRRKDQHTSRADLSLRLRKAAEELGPTYIKLGQIISSGQGIFPDELVAEFTKCRDQVPALSLIHI